MLRARKNETGATTIEFAFGGVSLLILVVSLVQMSLAMWSYHTLAYAVREGARYASTKGIGCTYTGNSCSVTVSNVAQKIAAAGIGLLPSQLSVTLTSSAGDVSCNPVSNCYSNTTVWPPSSPGSANQVGKPVKLTASYPVRVLFLPILGSLQTAAPTLQATSQQLILF